jgi:uncharacterized protein (DUF433 family)
MAESIVVSLRLPPAEAKRPRQLARRTGRTASEVGAELIGESLRRADFAFIDFRDSDDGRQACIQGTRVAVWQVISLLRAYRGDVAKTAGHLRWPEAKVHAAIAYTRAFPDEIELAIRENEAVDFEKLSRLLPGIKRFPDLFASKPREQPMLRVLLDEHIGGIARALCKLWKLQGELDSTNRTFFLQSPGG